MSVHSRKHLLYKTSGEAKNFWNALSLLRASWQIEVFRLICHNTQVVYIQLLETFGMPNSTGLKARPKSLSHL